MTSTAAHKRQMKLLREIAKEAEYRTDIALDLRRSHPMIDAKSFGGGLRFVDRENPQFAGGTLRSYDFNALLELGLIEPHEFYSDKRGNYGAPVRETVGVCVNAAGLERARQMERSKLAKMIEKQPLTALQITAAGVNTTWAAALAWVTANGWPEWLQRLFQW